MPHPQSTRICPTCLTPLSSSAWRTARYCSVRCANLARPVKTLAERFWAKVNRDGPIPAHLPDLGPCWVWDGATDGHGYGQIQQGPRSGRPLKAHRVSYEINVDSIPEGAEVLHRCDNPPCVRPNHLFLGTHQDNMDDMWSKGRAVMPDATGAANSQALLSPELAERIIREYVRGVVTQERLAQRYGVDHSTISDVIRRKHWASRHLS
jgi:hypothetical protein